MHASIIMFKLFSSFTDQNSYIHTKYTYNSKVICHSCGYEHKIYYKLASYCRSVNLANIILVAMHAVLHEN